MMESYEERLRTALDSGDTADAERIAREAFCDAKSDEHILAWLAAMMFENDIEPTFDLLEVFTERYPDSLHIPGVYLADLYARAGQFDRATEEARFYLRKAMDAGVVDALGEKVILREGVSRAFLLLGAAYTELGARAYSTRVLGYGLEFDLTEHWVDAIRGELARLGSELEQADNRAIDEKWEQFFGDGRNADELYEFCEQRGFPAIARRVDLLKDNFRFNRNFAIDRSEILMLVLSNDDNQFTLR